MQTQTQTRLAQNTKWAEAKQCNELAIALFVQPGGADNALIVSWSAESAMQSTDQDNWTIAPLQDRAGQI